MTAWADLPEEDQDQIIDQLRERQEIYDEEDATYRHLAAAIAVLEQARKKETP